VHTIRAVDLPVCTVLPFLRFLKVADLMTGVPLNLTVKRTNNKDPTLVKWAVYKRKGRDL
jgi:hypothetical protein